MSVGCAPLARPVVAWWTSWVASATAQLDMKNLRSVVVSWGADAHLSKNFGWSKKRAPHPPFKDWMRQRVKVSGAEDSPLDKLLG